MTIDRLRTLYDATPFQPFVIHLADGRTVPVSHRDFMMIAPSGRTVVVIQPDDSLSIISSLSIINVDASAQINETEFDGFVFGGFGDGRTASKTVLTAMLTLFALAVAAIVLLSFAT